MALSFKKAWKFQKFCYFIADTSMLAWRSFLRFQPCLLEFTNGGNVPYYMGLRKFYGDKMNKS